MKQKALRTERKEGREGKEGRGYAYRTCADVLLAYPPLPWRSGYLEIKHDKDREVRRGER